MKCGKCSKCGHYQKITNDGGFCYKYNKKINLYYGRPSYERRTKSFAAEGTIIRERG